MLDVLQHEYHCYSEREKMADEFNMRLEPVDELPEEDAILDRASWIPTEEELVNIKNLWRHQGGNNGPHAGYRKCSKCGNMAYCYGSTYERMTCLPCFTEKQRPKRKRKK